MGCRFPTISCSADSLQPRQGQRQNRGLHYCWDSVRVLKSASDDGVLGQESAFYLYKSKAIWHVNYWKKIHGREEEVQDDREMPQLIASVHRCPVTLC